MYSASADYYRTDYWRYLPGVGDATDWACSTTNAPASTGDCQRGRHFDGVNIAYIDGHVKFVTAKAVVYQVTEEAANRASA